MRIVCGLPSPDITGGVRLMDRRKRAWPVQFLITDEACPPAFGRASSPAKAALATEASPIAKEASSNITQSKNSVNSMNPKEKTNF